MSLLKKASKDNGENLLSWAKARMPILGKISQRFIKEKPLKGVKIGVALHLEKKTGILLQTLHDGGAEISASSCNPLTTDNDVASALKGKMEIYGWAGQTDEEYYGALNSVMSSNPQVIIDDGCDLILLSHAKYPQNLGNILGACEETTTGIVRLEAMQSDGKLKFPVMAVNNAHSKYLFDNRYGTGQSVIEGIVSATNTLIAGKNIVIAGYGWCGKGLADRLKGLGAKVFVVETTTSFSSGPSGLHRALEALYDGCAVGSMNDFVSEGDIFITATGNKHVITEKHFLKMKNGAILANAGHFNHEIDLDALQSLTKSEKTILPNLKRFDLENNKHVIMLSDGRLVNLSQPTGQGHPIEIMDASFGIQALCVEYLVRQSKNLEPHIHDVPNLIDNEVAKIALESHGIKLEELTKEQISYINSWQEGT